MRSEAPEDGLQSQDDPKWHLYTPGNATIGTRMVSNAREFVGENGLAAANFDPWLALGI